MRGDRLGLCGKCPARGPCRSTGRKCQPAPHLRPDRRGPAGGTRSTTIFTHQEAPSHLSRDVFPTYPFSSAEKAWQAFRDKGIKIHMLTDEERAEFYKRTQPVRDKFSKEIDPNLLKLIADTQK